MPDGARLALKNHGENAVVWRNEVLFFSTDEQRTALCPNSGVYDHDVNRARRIKFVGVRNGKRTIQNIEGRYVMIEVHNTSGGINVQDHALHRANQVIACAEISGESDYRVGQRKSPLERSFANNRNDSNMWSIRTLTEL